MKNSVEEIKSRLNIVEIIKEHTQLKQMGSNWKGLCPFHSEKTPSFMVSEDKQVWHCFGCGEGGDMFTFIEKIENVDFVEALRILARKANVTLEHVDQKTISRRNKLLQLHELAVQHYQKNLFSDQGKQAREYIKNRGLTKETVVAWRIGYALDAWDGVMKAAHHKHFSDEEIVASGLATRGEQGTRVYDRFRDRVMFSILDHNGQVVGFSGRLLSKDAKAAKYVNSPQSDIFDKSEVVFGLYQAKQAIKEQGFAILAEGQMDVISAHQAGTENVVASSGTALTEQQLRLLSRYTKELAVAYDQDSAGVKALERSIALALTQGFTVKVIVLPDGADPDSLIQEDENKWHELVASRLGYVEYYFDKVQRTLDLDTVQGKKQAAKEILSVLARLPDRVEQDVYVQRLGRILQVNADALRASLEQVTKPQSAHKSQAAANPAPTAIKNQSKQREQRILGCLIAAPESIAVVAEILHADDFQDEMHKNLYKTIVLFYNQHNTSNNHVSGSDWRTLFSQHIAATHNDLAAILQSIELLADDLIASDIDIARDAQMLASLLKRNILQQQIHSLHQLLESQPANADEVLQHISAITQQLKKLPHH